MTFQWALISVRDTLNLYLEYRHKVNPWHHDSHFNMGHSHLLGWMLLSSSYKLHGVVLICIVIVRHSIIPPRPWDWIPILYRARPLCLSLCLAWRGYVCLTPTLNDYMLWCIYCLSERETAWQNEWWLPSPWCHTCWLWWEIKVTRHCLGLSSYTECDDHHVIHFEGVCSWWWECVISTSTPCVEPHFIASQLSYIARHCGKTLNPPTWERYINK